MWEQQETGYGQLNKLMPDTVFSYSSNFSLLLSTTKEYLPQVRRHMHASVLECVAPCWCAQGWLALSGVHSWITPSRSVCCVSARTVL